MVMMGAKERFQKLLKKTFKKEKIKEKIRKNFNVTRVTLLLLQLHSNSS